ncbi:MAG TPA: tetratricopeptide repeat protein [Gammaproteobacteria bacterium]|nr:tetratricopeptide repeat protein [Gammaproteobacteria bacterium]
MRILLSVLLGLSALAAAASATCHETTVAASAEAGLGDIDFPNSGAAAAQPAFKRGVLLLHSFEFDAARAAFREGQQADPDFALAYWGEALSHNRPIWGEQDREAARAALQRLAPTPQARAAKAGTERERAYLASVELLFGDGDKRERDARYSEALGRLAEAYPDDLEARALYALSLLGLTGTKRDIGNYMRAAAQAELVYERNRRHPGALHYLIHAYDDPVHAPLGLRAARRYGQVAGAASHAQHMPSHVFFALGLWDEAVQANVTSLKVARDSGHPGYHALEWLAYAWLQQGRTDQALPLLALVDSEVTADPRKDRRVALATVRATVLVETEGDAPDSAWAPVDSTGIVSIAAFAAHDFARGVVAALQGRRGQADDALAALEARIGSAVVTDGAVAVRHDANTADQLTQARVLALALRGAMDAARGEPQGLDRVRDARERADALAFEYGPPWSAKPIDELYGELLLRAGRHAEAADAFERTLQHHPNRRLALRGLRAARGQEKGDGGD